MTAGPSSIDRAGLHAGRVADARKALRGEVPWTPALSRSDVLAEACEQEFAEVRAVVEMLRTQLDEASATAAAALWGERQ